MSRSRRKTQIHGNTTARSEKKWKKQASKKLRMAHKRDVREGNDLTDRRQIDTPWHGPKDGKRYVKSSSIKETAEAIDSGEYSLYWTQGYKGARYIKRLMAK